MKELYADFKGRGFFEPSHFWKWQLLLWVPLFFASSAIYPIAVMPGWLQVVAHLNPLTYQVDALRALMISNGPSTYPVALDLGVLAATVVVLVAIAARLYPRLAE